jgi:hypothetical protein
MNNYLDFFTQTELVQAIAKVPYVPGQLAPLFETRALAGTKLALEEQPEQGGDLITASSRGTPSKAASLARRAVHTFETAHYRHDAAVYADEVLNARAAGTEAMGELITARRDETLAMLRRNADATLEALRVAALTAPGNAFGSMGSEATIAFQTDATKTRAAIFTGIVKPMEDALGGVPFSGIDVYCSDGIWDDVIENKAIKDTYLYTQQAAALRGDARDELTWGGVRFIRYRGAGTTVITADKAIAVPTGVPGMFIQAFAPADTLDTVGVGGLGQPYHIQAYPIDSGNRGWHLELQTNPVMVCTRPGAVFSVKMA